MSTENTWSSENSSWLTENDPPQSENNAWPAQRKSSIWSPIKIGDSTLSMLDNVPPSPFTNNWTSNVFSFDFDFKAPSNSAQQKEPNDRPVFGELGNYSSTPPSSPGFAAPGSPCFLMPPPRSPLVPHAKAVIPKQQVFSTKVFIGGIPVGTTVEELESNLSFYGQCVVDWPNRVSTEVCPPNGYAFVVYQSEQCVIELYRACEVNEDNKIVFTVAAPNGAFKFTELKFWEVQNASCVCVPNWRQHLRHSTFVGGIARSCTAAELRDILEEEIGQVAHVDIEVDSITAYPKGAARVVFVHRESFLKAMAMKEMVLSLHNVQRRVELKPFLYGRMTCESCNNPSGNLFCNEVRCLRYFCQQCWKTTHSKPGMTTHQPMKRSQQKRGVGGAKGSTSFNI
ncbi:putative RNA-binding protein orb2-like isoform 2 [Aphelenchoides avenae]|nr:putative RNA-binding protein orb2-like isoform 2 [Aphelenchus avenae]